MSLYLTSTVVPMNTAVFVCRSLSLSLSLSRVIYLSGVRSPSGVEGLSPIENCGSVTPRIFALRSLRFQPRSFVLSLDRCGRQTFVRSCDCLSSFSRAAFHSSEELGRTDADGGAHGGRNNARVCSQGEEWWEVSAMLQKVIPAR